jgi:DtxR family Mn-dependent transcriptional regulator
LIDNHTHDAERVRDEVLEAVWVCRERNENRVECILQEAHADIGHRTLDRLVSEGLLVLKGDMVDLTERGEKMAASIIRRHRLAERLLVDVLGLTPAQSESIACTFEHGVVPEVVDAICTLLGHPTECPHGKAIPAGPGCKEGRTEVESALLPLSELPCGRPARVAYVRTRNHDRLHQLLSMGFAPGISIRVHQRTPVLVVELDQSEFALDSMVAEDVYVRPAAE